MAVRVSRCSSWPRETISSGRSKTNQSGQREEVVESPFARGAQVDGPASQQDDDGRKGQHDDAQSDEPRLRVARDISGGFHHGRHARRADERVVVQEEEEERQPPPEHTGGDPVETAALKVDMTDDDGESSSRTGLAG